jgi:hypothetical protein
MSQSQHSDVFPSSLYDDTDSIPYLAPENPQLFTPELSSSQQTFNSFEQDFLRPQPRLLIPSLFKRVGPDRRKAYVLYDNMMNTEWVEWWLETDCGKTSKINWDANHQSTIWKEFYQVANSSDGAPKVMCKRCGLILEHPSSLLRPGGKTRHGTSSLIRHRTTAACLKAASGAQTTGITKFLRDTVSSFLFKEIIYLLSGQ